MILMLVRRYVCLSRQATVRGDELSGVTVCVSIFLFLLLQSYMNFDFRKRKKTHTHL